MNFSVSDQHRRSLILPIFDATILRYPQSNKVAGIRSASFEYNTMVAIIAPRDDVVDIFTPCNLQSSPPPSPPSSITTILPLDSPSHPSVRSLLELYSANLIDVGTHMLHALREMAPHQLAARVGDSNDNLSYEMQDSRNGDITSMLLRGQRNRIGFHHDDSTTILSPSVLNDIQSFEQSVQSKLHNAHISYRGSYMRTLHTAPQPAHVDYDYPILTEHGQRLFLAFFPLTEEGTYLQLWNDPASLLRRKQDAEDEEKKCVSDDDDDEAKVSYSNHDSSMSSSRRIKPRSIVKGTIVYIPYGKMLIVPSDTIHGGGFKRGSSGNLRFHLYIAVGDDDEENVDDQNNDNRGEEKRIELLQHPMNKYTERYDRTRELCERFVDSNGMNGLLGHYFDD
ncbi:hypothetical protein ACHAWU_000861 [Discostella pseudostelligera]|uniref:Uncharacterized protein n=1 Tax=Discostella pseudostelligera TaxID=259834 RepID=A0ABD3MBM5_9STRA